MAPYFMLGYIESDPMTFHAHDVILPTQTHGDIKLRCVTQPDAAQSALLERLGIVLPKRIRSPFGAPDVPLQSAPA